MNDRSHPNHPDNADSHTGEILDGEVIEEVLDPISVGALATLQRVEIDQQVATAKQYPRNVTKIKAELTALVTIDEDTADDCIYALPRGNKHIKGPSARFADALISFWGNARSGAFITQVDREEKFVEAIGFFQDVERNVIRQRRVRRPISSRDGRIYNADMINMTGNAACVIAERNAILNGVPKSLWSSAYEKAFALVAGTTGTMKDKLDRIGKAFLVHGITMEQVLAKLERQDESKILPDDIVTLRGVLNALRDGTETVETIFGRGAASNHEKVQNPLKDDPEQMRGAATTDHGADEAPGKRRADPISSGPQRTESGASPNSSGTKIEQTEDSGRSTTSNATSNEAGKSDKAVETSERLTGAAAKGAAAEQKAAAAKAPARPYEDAEGYMAHVRDQLDAAKNKAAVTELWGSTRSDRNELLSPEQIEELTKDKDAKLSALKLKEAK